MPPRILIVDAEPVVRSGYERLLRREGFQVVVGSSGREGFELALKETPDLIILDPHLPDINGQDMCQRIRQTPEVRTIPILAVSAHVLDGEATQCLNQGADGYLRKPVDGPNLVANVRAMLRRPRNYFMEKDVIRKGRISIRVAERRAIFDRRELPNLTPKEFELLKELVCRSPRYVSKEALAMKVWGLPFDQVHRRTVDVHVQRIRRKLGSPASSFLKTVTLVGYRWFPSPNL